MVTLKAFHEFISENIVIEIRIEANILLLFIICIFCFLIFRNELLNVKNDKFSSISLR
jgi:hypothetical protein